MTDEVDNQEEYAGFSPNFSRECQAIFEAARLGVFLTMEEIRNNLRIAGMWLGADTIEAPRFELPEPPSDDEPEFDDPAFDDVDEGEDD